MRGFLYILFLMGFVSSLHALQSEETTDVLSYIQKVMNFYNGLNDYATIYDIRETCPNQELRHAK